MYVYIHILSTSPRAIYIYLYIYIYIYIHIYSVLFPGPHGRPLCAHRPTWWVNWRACCLPSSTQPCDTVRLDRDWKLEVGALLRRELAHHCQKLRGSGMVFGEVPCGLAVSFDKLDHLQLTPTSMTKSRAQFVCCTVRRVHHAPHHANCRPRL